MAHQYDGVINDYDLVRTKRFVPRGTLLDTELAAEDVVQLRWWTRAQITEHERSEVFSPRDLRYVAEDAVMQDAIGRA